MVWSTVYQESGRTFCSLAQQDIIIQFPVPGPPILQASCEEENELVLTDEKGVLSTQLLQDVHTLAPCSHKEADSRVLLHVSHAAQHGHNQMLIRTVHIYIAVLNYLLDMKCG